MEEEKKVEKKDSKVWYFVITIIVVLAIVGAVIWYFSKKTDDTTTDSTATEKVTVTIPDGWKGFTSSKYHFSLSYPSDYTLAESAVGTLKFTKGGTEMIDMYVYAANGDEAGMMSSTEALYSDDTKGYMIMDSIVQGKVAGFTAKTINGKFGKNAGVSQTHEGITGSAAMFTTDNKLFIFDSYDNGDTVATKNFTDFLGTISF
jgi:hypothetical protein